MRVSEKTTTKEFICKKIIMKVYYINRDVHQQNDVIIAVKKAWQLAKLDTNIKRITLLVPGKSNYGLLDPLKLGEKVYSNNGFAIENIAFQIRTVKTYKPKYLFEGKEPSEILVSLCVRSEELYAFEDYSDIAYWIVAPWLLSENRGFLSIHEAEDCLTGEVMSHPGAVNDRIANGIDWLYRNAYPNQGFVNTSDEDCLKSVAIALKKMHVEVNYEQVVYYCLRHGYLPHVARKVADYFVQAQTHNMKTRTGLIDLRAVLNAPRKK